MNILWKPRTDRDPDELFKTSDVGGKRFLSLVVYISGSNSHLLRRRRSLYHYY